jgi:hypothetical protein
MSKEAAREAISPVVSATGTPSTYVDSTIIDCAKTVNLTFYDQVKAADQKVAFVFTFIAAILIFWSSSFKKGFTGVALSDLTSLRWLLTYCFFAALCFTITCAGLVIFPRVRPSDVSLFWGAWPAAARKVRKVPDFTSSHFVLDEYVENSHHLAAICQHKFRFVGLAYRGLFAMILFHISTLTLG